MNEQNKMWWIGGVVVVALLAIGYGIWGGKKPTPIESPAPIVTSTETSPGAWTAHSNPAVVAAGKNLMNEIKATQGDISLVSVTSADWPNGCLGLADEQEMCTQALVPGYEVRFTARGVEFIYHTNSDGTVLRMQTPFDVKG